ncbi:hypothetical protein WJX73_001589 [Symbiochloris irregularis]|uniref:Uncharacterized protein n=1 Tax=Symbiochloris irregularis TaxID=706552 RepID=A0AAW1P181_9CHLO
MFVDPQNIAEGDLGSLMHLFHTTLVKLQGLLVDVSPQAYLDPASIMRSCTSVHVFNAFDAMFTAKELRGLFSPTALEISHDAYYLFRQAPPSVFVLHAANCKQLADLQRSPH